MGTEACYGQIRNFDCVAFNDYMPSSVSYETDCMLLFFINKVFYEID